MSALWAGQFPTCFQNKLRSSNLHFFGSSCSGSWWWWWVHDSDCNDLEQQDNKYISFKQKIFAMNRRTFKKITKHVTRFSKYLEALLNFTDTYKLCSLSFLSRCRVLEPFWLNLIERFWMGRDLIYFWFLSRHPTSLRPYSTKRGICCWRYLGLIKRLTLLFFS
jgi:hypothetical protein